MKVNLDLTAGAPENLIEDESYEDIGAPVFNIDHDLFYGENLFEIWTEAGKTGTKLVQDTDFQLTGISVEFSSRAGRNVYSTVLITNPTYQTGFIWLTYQACGDLVDADDRYQVNRTDSQYWKLTPAGGFEVYSTDTGANSINFETLGEIQLSSQEGVSIQDDSGAKILVSSAGAASIMSLAGQSVMLSDTTGTFGVSVIDGKVLLQGSSIDSNSVKVNTPGGIDADSQTGINIQDKHLGTGSGIGITLTTDIDNAAGTGGDIDIKTTLVTGISGDINLDSGSALSLKDEYLTVSIPLSETGETGLSGFTATSIVGALNEAATLGGGGGTGIGVGRSIGETYWFPGNGTIPKAGLICDGTLYDIIDYPGLFGVLGTTWGGDGTTTFGVPDLQGIHPGMIGTSVINTRTKGDATAVIGDYLEDQFQGHEHTLADGIIYVTSSSPTNDIGTANSNSRYTDPLDTQAIITDGSNGTPRTDEYTDISQAMGRWVIQAFDDNYQEIPADPGLIKDWVSKWTGSEDTSVTNLWGEGSYKVKWKVFSSSVTHRIGFVDVISGIISRGNFSGTATAGELGYVSATMTDFEVTSTNWPDAVIIEILRWEDVAGADVQMDPPVDGWEQKFYDYSNTADVVNSWGSGYYSMLCRVSTGNSFVTSTIRLNISEFTSGNYVYGTTPGGTNNARIKYDFDTNIFSVDTSAGTYYIAEIHKFNSLVNVLHSYHPDPRSVAQKDWVELYNSDGGSGVTSINNSWGTGLYIFITDSSIALDVQRTGVLDLYDLTKDAYSSTSGTSSQYRVKYDQASGVFIPSADATRIHKILKYQDSQASDAPREILEDGWELVYDDPGNTAQVPNIWGSGLYMAEIWNAGNTNLVYGQIRTQFGAGLIETTPVFIQVSGPEKIQFRSTNSDNFSVLNSGITDAYDIQKIWKFTGLLRISAQYNVTSLSDGPNQVQAINTDAGDEAVTLPSSPDLGDLFEVWNTGSNGNHVQITTDGSTLYNGLTIGDNKGLKLRYIDGWKYEDVIIDEYTKADGASIDQHVTKWAGGRMTLYRNRMVGTATVVITFVEPYINTDYIIVGYTDYTNEFAQPAARYDTKTTTGFTLLASSGTNYFTGFTSEGRWKIGV